MEEDDVKGFPFLALLFVPDYPTLLPWCRSPCEGLIHCLDNAELMWSESFGVEVLSLIFFGLLFEDLKAFYKELYPCSGKPAEGLGYWNMLSSKKTPNFRAT